MILVDLIDCTFGAKYFFVQNGKVHPCYLKAVVFDEQSETELPDLILVTKSGDVRINVEFHFDGETHNYEETSFDGVYTETFNSPLFLNIEDFKEKKYVQYKIYNDENFFEQGEFLKKLNKNLSYDNDGVLCGWVFDNTSLRPRLRICRWNFYQEDSEGFHTDINDSVYYKTEEEAWNANNHKLMYDDF